MAVLFDKQKSLALNGVDLSRKGSIDEEIVPLVQHINNHVNFFTTSSCSGRIIVFDDHIDEERPGLKVKKKGCKWLFTSHKAADAEQVIESLKELNGDAVFKFEPFVLHVQCRNTEYAQRTLCCAVSSGFRNSGISLGNKGKIIVGVRSTHGLEAPLSKDGNLLVSMEFIRFLTKSANKKLEENFLRIQKFFESMKKIDSLENKLARRERKKKEKKSSGENDTQSVKGEMGGSKSDLDLNVKQCSPGNAGVINPGTAEDNIHVARSRCDAEGGSDEDSSSGTPVNEDNSTIIGGDMFDENRFSQGAELKSPNPELQEKENRTASRKTSPPRECQGKGDLTKDGKTSPTRECQGKGDLTKGGKNSPPRECQGKGDLTKDGKNSSPRECQGKEAMTKDGKNNPPLECLEKDDPNTGRRTRPPLEGQGNEEDPNTGRRTMHHLESQEKEDSTTERGTTSPPVYMVKEDSTTERGTTSPPVYMVKEHRTTGDIEKSYLSKDVT